MSNALSGCMTQCDTYLNILSPPNGQKAVDLCYAGCFYGSLPTGAQGPQVVHSWE